MLKWTASAQKVTLDSPNIMPHTPRRSELEHRRRRARRATIANKENIPYMTSTPLVRTARNSPIVLAPLADILNITPEINSPARNININTPEQQQQQRRQSPAAVVEQIRKERNSSRNHRRHSTLGITLPSAVPVYARTLPRFQVEEYSPSTVAPAPTLSGQQLALRGLLPDPFLSKARYFTTPEIKQQQNNEQSNFTEHGFTKSTLKKRKLDLEYNDECEHKFLRPNNVDTTTVSSAKMGDETLDKLIDAILDSACKDVKKKKSKKSFNLRRRTLLRNQPETVHEVVLSPSYAAGDDPASDLSFLLIEPPVVATPKPKPMPLPQTQTPAPATPPKGITPISTPQLCKMPTPTSTLTPALNFSTKTFNLETPIRVHQTRKRRQTHHFGSADAQTTASTATNQAKKYKVDARNYFEIGVALPSIYV